MCCASLRRVLAVIAFGGLAMLLAGPHGSAQVGGAGGGAGGRGGGPGGGGKARAKGFGAAPAVALPEGLNHVPIDATAFVHIRIADSLGGPASQALLKQLRPDGAHGKLIAQLEQRLGVRLADVDSITVFMLDLPGTVLAPLSAVSRAASPLAAAAEADESPAVLVALTYSKPVDRKAVLRALARSEPAVLPKLSGMFLSDRCVLFGSPAELLSYTTRARTSAGAWDDGTGAFGPGGFSSRSSRGSLAAALAAGAEPHLIVAGAQVSTLARSRLRLTMRGGNLGPYGALLPLLNTSMGLTVDMRDAVEMTVRFIGPGGDQLTLEAVQALRTLAEIALDGKALSEGPAALSPDLHKAVRKAVAQANVEQAGTRVEMRVRLEASPEELARLLAQTVVRLR